MITPDLPVLYSFRRCPYAMRARMGLAVSRQSYVLREVDLKDRPAQLREVSAKATVPVLILANGKVLDQSLQIMRWTLAISDPQHWLKVPPSKAAQMDAWIAHCDSDFKHHLDRYKYATRYPDVRAEDHRTQAAEFLFELDRRLKETAYLGGPDMSLVDVALAPFVRQFASADRDWFEHQSWPALRCWLEAFVATDLFTGIMKKYPVWKMGDSDRLIFNG
jgi:glutathione S-transferase